MRNLSRIRLHFMLMLSCLFFSASIFAQDKEWRPIPPEQLAAKTSGVEPNADAEALLWEVRIDDSSSEGFTRRHYVRVKIFTELGREKYSKMDIPYYKGLKIKDLEARVVKPDGSIVEIGKADIFEREIIKAGGVKVKAKSFAVPNIEPGVIVEYRYKESYEDGGASGSKLPFQRDIPVQRLSYYYKPYNSKEPKYQSYNFNDAKFTKDSNGYWIATRTNVPAFREEPRMPPQDTVRPWMLLTSTQFEIVGATSMGYTYTVKNPSDPKSYWGGVSSERLPLLKFITKSDKDIRTKAEELTAGLTDPDAKLRKIYAFCQNEIKNTSYDPTLTDEDRRKLPPVKSIGDVLKRGQGSAMYIDFLFGALANAAGFEINIALIPDKKDILFQPEMTVESHLHTGAIAVKIGDDFKFLDPGSKFVPYGMLAWYEEGNWSLIAGEKNYFWRQTPLADQTRSNTKRNAKFELLEDGTLQGKVAIEITGHPAIYYRTQNYDETTAKLEEDLKESLKARYSTAEISNVSVTNLLDPAKPLVQTYSIKIPGYGQKTGKRIFFQPGFFEFGSTPVFTNTQRKYDVLFSYPWSETDVVQIALPEGFALDNADAPQGVGDPQKISKLEVNIGVTKDGKEIVYRRNFFFGGGGNLLFPVQSYPILKSMFDEFHKTDTHSLTVKQK